MALKYCTIIIIVIIIPAIYKLATDKNLLYVIIDSFKSSNNNYSNGN